MTRAEYEALGVRIVVKLGEVKCYMRRDDLRSFSDLKQILYYKTPLGVRVRLFREKK